MPKPGSSQEMGELALSDLPTLAELRQVAAKLDEFIAAVRRAFGA